MRRRTISIDCSTALLARSLSAARDSVAETTPSVLVTWTSDWPVDGSGAASTFCSAGRHGAGLGGIARPDGDAVLRLVGGQARVEDVGVTQGAAGAVDHAVQPFLHHGIHVDLHQQIAATAQVETQMHRPPGQPGRRGRHQVGNAQQHPERAGAEDQRDLQAAEIQHGAQAAPQTP